MKSSILFRSILWLAAQGLTWANEAPLQTIELQGIMSSSEPKALMKVAPGLGVAAPLPNETRRLILAKGEKVGEIEVVDIDEVNGKVTIRTRGQKLELALGTISPLSAEVAGASAPTLGEKAQAVPLVGLHRIDLDQAFHLYQAGAHRSVIRPGSLPALELEIQPKGTETGTELAKVIERALMEKGIKIQLDGDKFAIVSDHRVDAEKITRELARARELAALIENTRKASEKAHVAGQPSASLSELAGQEEMLPAGALGFRRTDPNQVLDIYGPLTDRTLIRNLPHPGAAISFQTYTPLTREESIYALTAVLAINGVSIVAAGEKLLLVAPAFEEGELARLVSQKGPLDYSSLTSAVPSSGVSIPSGSLEVFAGAYGQLAGRKVELGPGLPRINLGLVAQTELTAREALQALDLLFGLHGLKVTSQEDSATLTIVADSHRPE